LTHIGRNQNKQDARLRRKLSRRVQNAGCKIQDLSKNLHRSGIMNRFINMDCASS
jgi:hypothetical protein